MKALIVENEIYLAQSLSSKLEAKGFNCDIKATINDINKNDNYEVILLSTDYNSEDISNIIKRYRQKSIIILLVSYISTSTVAEPIKQGANDYVVKPFVIDELLKKIEHYKEYKELKIINNILESYTNFINEQIEQILDIEDFPIIINTDSTQCAKHIALQIAISNKLELKFKDIENKDIENLKLNDNTIYLIKIDNIKSNLKKTFFEKIDNKKVILITNSTNSNITKTKCKNSNLSLEESEILSINDYVKKVILEFQSIYPDTELSRRLGISRKSLWEKRKKLDIIKK